MPRKPKPARGGARKGAGRPAIPGLLRVLITILPEDAAIADRLGEGNRSKGIALALRAAEPVAAG